MQQTDGLTPQDSDLERSLRKIRPAAVMIDPVSAAFEAGRKLSRRNVWMWRGVASVMLLVGLAGWLRNRPAAEAPSATSIGYVAAQPQAPAPQSLLMLQRAVSDNGVDALPPAQIPRTQAIGVGDIF